MSNNDVDDLPEMTEEILNELKNLALPVYGTRN